jgi:LacI family transcriptional regulator
MAKRNLTNKIITPIGSVRLKDIAERVGVSVTVVSKALHNTKASVRMSPATQDRIRKLAEKMGYRPSAAGRMLSQKKTDVIGIIASYRDDKPQMQYVADIMAPACRILWEHQKNLMVLDLPYDAERMAQDILPSMVSEGRVDAVLVLEPHYNPVLCGELDKIGFPWVGIDAKEPELIRPYNQVITETSAVTEIPFGIFVNEGHRRLAYLHYDSPYWTETIRHEGVGRVLADFPDVSLIRIPYRGLSSSGNNDLLNYSQHLQEKLFPKKKPEIWPTAIFCDNDWMALALYDATTKRGLTIPGDLSVIGYGNERVGEMLDPTLSTIAIDPIEACGADMVLRLLTTGKNQPNVGCRPRYIQRQSCED